MIKFSVIIPVHNVEKYLSACLDSVLNQKYPHFEVIVIDDVSTDSSRQIAEDYAARFPEKLNLIVHQVNTRQGGARNTGIDAATGDYLVFLDSDDYLKPNALETLEGEIAASNADIVEFCYDFVDEQCAFLRRFSFRQRIEQAGTDGKPLLISTMCPWNKAYRATLFDDPQMRFVEKYYYEDYCLIPRLVLAANRVHYIEDSLIGYRQRPFSTIHDTNIDRNKDILVCTDSLLHHFREKNLSAQLMEQFEFVAIEHILLHATLRVNSIDRRSSVQQQLLRYMQEHFPNFPHNPYRSILTRRQQKLLSCIEKAQYMRLNLMWEQRNRFTGFLKRLKQKVAK